MSSNLVAHDAPMDRTRCRACGSALGSIYEANEMMMGSGGTFSYLECADCRSLSLIDAPADLSPYYRQDYYSMATERNWGKSALRRKAYAVRRRVLRRPAVRAAVSRFTELPAWVQWASIANLKADSRILDVGCGNGFLLTYLSAQGFSNLGGIDPYLPADTSAEGVPLWRRTMDEMPGQFDFVMLNHSFEHMAYPQKALMSAVRLLAPRGTLMIRTPVAGTHAWRTYGVHWVQLDAPRHLCITSRTAMLRLATDTGLRHIRTLFDSSAFQFWGSEQYRRGVPLASSSAHSVSPTVLKRWEEEARELNRRDDGDQAAYFFSPKTGCAGGSIRDAASRG